MAGFRLQALAQHDPLYFPRNAHAARFSQQRLPWRTSWAHCWVDLRALAGCQRRCDWIAETQADRCLFTRSLPVLPICQKQGIIKIDTLPNGVSQRMRIAAVPERILRAGGGPVLQAGGRRCGNRAGGGGWGYARTLSEDTADHEADRRTGPGPVAPRRDDIAARR